MKIGIYWMMALLLLLFCTCARQNNILATDKAAKPSETTKPNIDTPVTEIENDRLTDSQNNDQENPLKKLLAEASWDSITEAKRQGKAALPIIRSFLKNESYQVRQMAVSSAGAIGVDEASDILSAGVKDSNINVRLAAAKELSKQAYPSAAETVLEIVKTSADETVRELLLKSAGFLPGEKTIATLRPLSKTNGIIADQAVYALAKLGDSSGVNLVSSKLSAKLPRTRYEALQNLCYINDLRFVPTAEKLLSDKAEAIRVGPIRKPQMRRVADAAVESLVCLLGLHLPYSNSKTLYTDEEINEVRNLAKKKEE